MTGPLSLPDSPQTATPTAPPPQRPHCGFYRVFVGPRGVRAGWKVLIFFLLMAGIAMGLHPIGSLLPKVPRGSPAPPSFALLEEFIGMIAVLLATAIMAKWIDRKPWGYFSIPVRNAFRSTFWTGAAVGLGALALQLEIMHLGGWFDFGTLQLHGAAIVGYGAIWALMFFFTGVTEEGLLRGYVQRVTTDGLSKLPRGWSFWASALLFSVMFGAGHLSNPGENKFGIVMAFVDGMAMCFSLWRTGDLWWAIGNHAAWDWGETFLFGTPNSGMHAQKVLMHPAFHGPLLLAGGTAGPEGSMLVLISEALFIISVALIYRRRKYPLVSSDAAQQPAISD
jgi:membrane protease YdiL (CAAX protease family)